MQPAPVPLRWRHPALTDPTRQQSPSQLSSQFVLGGPANTNHLADAGVFCVWVFLRPTEDSCLRDHESTDVGSYSTRLKSTNFDFKQ